VDAAVDRNLIEKRGSWLSLDGKQLGQGRDAARDNLKNDPEMTEMLLQKIRDAEKADAK